MSAGSDPGGAVALCVWRDGAWQRIAPDRKLFGLSDRGLALGDGLFETLLWTGGAIRFLDDHMARLFHGAGALGLSVPAKAGEIEAGLGALCEGLGGQRAAIRLVLTRGAGPRGLTPPAPGGETLSASVSTLDTPGANMPARLARVSIQRNAGAPSARFKTLSYVDQVVALAEAKARGGDEAVMAGAEGRIASAAAANLIVGINGGLVTPPVADGALPGIVRGRLIRAGLVREAEIEPAALDRAATMFLTNALVGVRAVGALDGRTLAPDMDRTAALNAALDG